MTSSDDLRTRLTAATLAAYFRAAGPVTLTVLEAPPCILVIDGPAGYISLWAPADGLEPDVTALNRLELRRRPWEHGEAFVLAAQAESDHYEAYSLLAAVAEDLAKGMSYRVAVSNSLATYRDLLSRRGRLSDEKVVGLTGELLVLEHLLATLGEEDALAAWVGPDSEEHDFVLPDEDFEVKTTTTEQRRHVIGTETQLERTGRRTLWLLSLQLTLGGASEESFTLPEVIDRIRGRLSSQTALDLALAKAGYHEGDADLYRERFLWRSEPRAYLVDDQFPAITRSGLEGLVAQPALVGAVSYRVDVTTLMPGTPGAPMDAFVKEH